MKQRSQFGRAERSSLLVTSIQCPLMDFEDREMVTVGEGYESLNKRLRDAYSTSSQDGRREVFEAY